MIEVQIQFLGGAGTVTGSRFLVQALGHTLLLDCGLFQGLKSLRLQNWQDLAFPPRQIDAVLLTHGHMDHAGYLPCLIRQGFRGPVYCSEPSQEVAAIILRDSAKIQQEEAARANRQGYSRHRPARPLYTMKEAERALTYFHTVKTSQWQSIFAQAGIRARWQYNGHILGACFIELDLAGKTLVISGDIGRADDWLLYPPHKPQRADVLLMESTYGDRLHPVEDVFQRLEELAWSTVNQAGSLLIPCFAIERTQTVLWLLWQLQRQGRLPQVPVILDSPMGAAMLAIFERFTDWHRLNWLECQAMKAQVQVVAHAHQTEKLAQRRQPKIVLAGSGMLSGGRILSYLRYELSNPRSTILLTGYQAEGTRGRALLEGQPTLKIQGAHYPVRARVAQLESLSAHADQKGLLDWLSELTEPPQKTWLVHGEPSAAAGLQAHLQQYKGWQAQLAQAGQCLTFNL